MSTDAAIPVTLQGVPGTVYQHGAFARNSSWNAVAGNYAVMKLVQGNWTVLYVGETDNLKNRLSNHERQPCFDRYGWTHLAFRAETTTSVRTRVETEFDEPLSSGLQPGGLSTP